MAGDLDVDGDVSGDGAIDVELDLDGVVEELVVGSAFGEDFL